MPSLSLTETFKVFCKLLNKHHKPPACFCEYVPIDKKSNRLFCRRKFHSSYCIWWGGCAFLASDTIISNKDHSPPSFPTRITCQKFTLSLSLTKAFKVFCKFLNKHNKPLACFCEYVPIDKKPNRLFCRRKFLSSYCIWWGRCAFLTSDTVISNKDHLSRMHTSTGNGNWTHWSCTSLLGMKIITWIACSLYRVEIWLMLNTYSMKTYVLLLFEHENDVTIIVKLLYGATSCKRVALWSLIMIMTSFLCSKCKRT